MRSYSFALNVQDQKINLYLRKLLTKLKLFSKHAFDKWESKFSDFLGSMYNEFCHNFHFDEHKKLKLWQPDGTLIITNNSTHILSELKTGKRRKYRKLFTFLLIYTEITLDSKREVQFWNSVIHPDENWTPDNILLFNESYYLANIKSSHQEIESRLAN